MKKRFLFLLLLCAALSGAELLYCLQPTLKRGVFPARAAQTGRSHIVIDEAYDGSPKTCWTAAELKQFKQNKAVVLCYLSIGEAENYRGYWKKAWKKNPPAFLLKENPEWKGNYRVRYWAKEWQTLILKELDRIVAAGFDGVYLDIVDGFEYFEEQAQKELARNPETSQSYREDMVQWILEIARHARSKNPKFQIFMQNGEALLVYKKLFREIDGIVLEDLYSDGKKIRKKTEIQWRLQYIFPCLEAKKCCFAVEYISPAKREMVLTQVKRYKIPVLITDRELKSFGLFLHIPRR